MNLNDDLLSEVNNNTNGKIIVVDKKGTPCFVLMSFTAYKNLKTEEKSDQSADYGDTLTSDDILAKINHDIAQWEENQNPDILDEDYFSQDTLEKPFYNDDMNETEESVYLESIDE